MYFAIEAFVHTSRPAACFNEPNYDAGCLGGDRVFVPRVADQGVEGEFPGTEKQNDQADKPENEWVGADEFVGTREYLNERIAIRGEVRDAHINDDADRKSVV